MSYSPESGKLFWNVAPVIREHSIQRSARRSNNRRECRERLEQLKSNGESTFELEEEFEELFEYKNRQLTARLLHFAIFWSHHHGEEHATSVRLVLQAHADLSAQASYDGRGGARIELECIHIAAGLGDVPAMKALLDWHPVLEWESEQLLDRFSMIDGKPFYAPLHDAAFLGRKDAVMWLLENDADATLENKDGFTALHWVAFQGLQSKDELKSTVLSLVEHKAKLNVKTSVDAPDPRKRGLQPLEMAALHESRFPKELMYLLAPSLQLDKSHSNLSSKLFDSDSSNLFDSDNSHSNFGATGSSLLTDLCVLAGHHRMAALKLAQQLKYSPRLHNRARASSQEEGVVDRVAHLFHTVPLAAADFLDILLIHPEVQDPQRHPINTRASFSGFFQSVYMRCAYQSDATDKEVCGTRLLWPEWKLDPAMDTWPDWHGELVQVPDRRYQASICEYDAETKVLLLPDVININVLMALAQTSSVNKQVFANFTVQAIVSFVWKELVAPVLAVSMFFELVELMVLLHWGLAPLCLHFESCSNDGLVYLAKRSSSIHWSILFAGFLREVINVVWGLLAYIRQWNTCRQKDGSLHELYRPIAILKKSGCTPQLLHSGLKAVFLWSSMQSSGGPLSGQARALLAVNLALQSWKLIYRLRVVLVGANKLLLFAHTFLSGSMREMISVSFLVYASFVFIHLVIRHDPLHDHGGWKWTALHLYRTLIIGDGESLDSIGVSTEEEEPLLTGFMIFGTAIFNIVIMNLFIAIYTTQYGQLEGDGELLFHQERASLACRSILQSQKVQDLGPSRCARILLTVTVPLAFSAGIVLLTLPEDPWRELAAGLFAFAEVLWQALCMRSRCETSKPHFLWISHRAEMPGAQLDDAASDTPEFSTALKNLQKRVNRMDDKFDNLAGDISKILSKLEGSAMQRSRSCFQSVL